MFPTEPDPRPETPAEQDRRRARAGTDRRGLKHVVIAMVMTFGGLALVFAADVVGVERRLTTATVVGFIDRWNMKRGHECVTLLTTGYGYAQIYTRNLCHEASWHIGDTAEVEARQLRFSRTIVLSTHGTIFKGAHSILPES